MGRRQFAFSSKIPSYAFDLSMNNAFLVPTIGDPNVIKDSLLNLWIKVEQGDEPRREADNMPIQLEKEDIQEMIAQAMKTALQSEPAAPMPGKKETDEEGKIGAISVELPSFWSEHPEAWFLSAECQFNTKSIKCCSTRNLRNLETSHLQLFDAIWPGGSIGPNRGAIWSNGSVSDSTSEVCRFAPLSPHSSGIKI